MTEEKPKKKATQRYLSPGFDFERVTKRNFDAVCRIGDLEDVTRVLHMIVDRACRKRHKELVKLAEQKDMALRVGDRITWTEGVKMGRFTSQVFEGECIGVYKGFYLMRLKSGSARTIQKKSDYEIIKHERGVGQKMKSMGGVKEDVSDEE